MAGNEGSKAAALQVGHQFVEALALCVAFGCAIAPVIERVHKGRAARAIAKQINDNFIIVTQGLLESLRAVWHGMGLRHEIGDIGKATAATTAFFGECGFYQSFQTPDQSWIECVIQGHDG
jgi:hypothetical protein